MVVTLLKVRELLAYLRSVDSHESYPGLVSSISPFGLTLLGRHRGTNITIWADFHDKEIVDADSKALHYRIQIHLRRIKAFEGPPDIGSLSHCEANQNYSRIGAAPRLRRTRRRSATRYSLYSRFSNSRSIAVSASPIDSCSTRSAV